MKVLILHPTLIIYKNLLLMEHSLSLMEYIKLTSSLLVAAAVVEVSFLAAVVLEVLFTKRDTLLPQVKRLL